MKKILLVSNQEAFLGRNKTLLNRAGFVILTATSATEALQAFREQPVDLIISMLEMPDMAGDTLCSLIRKDKEGTAVPFILVCYDTDGAVKRATDCGANGWLTKPVHPERLLEKVAKYLRIPTRRDFRVPFSAKVRGQREALSFSGLTHNISASGILCETQTYLNHDDVLTNLLLAIDSHGIVTDGKVVRSETPGDGIYKYGVQFTNLPEESRERIEKFIAAPPPQTAT